MSAGSPQGGAPTRHVASTAAEYGRALAPHLEHEGYRCDRPGERLMGRGCRTCGVEVVIRIADFRASGDLEAYEREARPTGKKGKKGSAP